MHEDKIQTFFCNLMTEVHFFSKRPAYFLSNSSFCLKKKTKIYLKIVPREVVFSHMEKGMSNTPLTGQQSADPDLEYYT